MRITSLLGCFVLGTLAACAAAHAADFEITGITGNGELTWDDTNTNGTYTVQWSPSLAQTNWSSDWSALTQIAATGGTIRARIPMFFRVIHRPRQSQSANMRLVSGGGQPQGPQYDFYVAKNEVSTDEFCGFLNDAQANPGNARGSNMYFSDQGDVFMDSAMASWEIMFKITESRLLYNSTAAIGTRYTVNTDYLGHPITGVSWYGAVKYCNWLTVEEGRGLTARCYTEGTEYTNWQPAHLTYAQWNDGFTDSERLQWVQNYAGFRLPMDQGNTSANYYNEFFKSASWSCTSNVLYGFGRSTINGQDANYNGSGDPYEPYTFETTPVGYYDGSNHGGAFQTRSNANYYGIFDLAGNVQEWQNDFWMDGQIYRWLRGGCWTDNSGNLSNTQTPNHSDPTWCYRTVGFRVVSSQP